MEIVPPKVTKTLESLKIYSIGTIIYRYLGIFKNHVCNTRKEQWRTPCVRVIHVPRVGWMGAGMELVRATKKYLLLLYFSMIMRTFFLMEFATKKSSNIFKGNFSSLFVI